MHKRTIEFSDFGAAAQGKSMWVGDKTAILQPMALYDGASIVTRKVVISEALLKCVDEILVNSIDQHTSCSQAPASAGGPVTQITCDILPSGVVIISNNGGGFPVEFKEEYNMWTVEAAYTREHTGSSISENKFRLTGGTNGLGLKLITNNALYVQVETYDTTTHRLYKQKFTCATGNKITAERPIIVDGPATFRGSKTTYMPNYALLCAMPDGTDWRTTDNLKTFQQIIHLRMLQVAAWCDSVTGSYAAISDTARTLFPAPCNVFYQGRRVICTVERLGELACPGRQVSTVLSSAGPQIRYPWTVSIALAPPAAKVQFHTLINGIFVETSKHASMLVAILAEQVATAHATRGKLAGLDPDAAKKVTSQAAKFIAGMLHCTNARFVPNPQWSGQTKGKLGGATAANMAPYKFADAYVTAIWEMIKVRYDRLDLGDELRDQAATIGAIRIRKHERAEWYGRQLPPAEFAKMRLDLGEGDAALLLIKGIIAALKLQRYHGTYSLGGVPPNVLKQIRKQVGPNEYLMSKMLQNNIPLQGLVKILGLQYNEDYANDAAYYKLKYSGVIICTDQDADGIGQIASIVVLFFLTFWPSLIDRGFVQRWDTPIIRVRVAGDRIRDYYDEAHYEAFATAHPEVVGKDGAVKYYKGLAAHEKADMKNMAAHFHEHIYTYTRDSAAAASAEIMYGRKTAPRKAEHLKAEIMPYPEASRALRSITVTEQMLCHAKMFQREMYSRKLPHVLDGMIPAQRMAFACIRETPATAQKIYQWSGKVANDYKYAHGDMSLNGTIIKMAQNFPGSNVLPKLQDIGMFGGVKYGRGVAGSPRYIGTKLNSKLMQIIFPAAFDDMLPYVWAEGERTEPQYYIGIIPMAVLETVTTAAAGWNVNIFARKLEVVLHVLRLRILTNRNVWHLIDRHSATPVSVGLAGQKLVRVTSIPTKSGATKGVIEDTSDNTDVSSAGSAAAGAANVANVGSGAAGAATTLATCEIGLPTTRREGNTLIVTGLPTKLWSEHVRCHLLGEDLNASTRAAKSAAARNKTGKPINETPTPKATKTQLTADAIATASANDMPYSQTIVDVYDRTDGATVDMHIMFHPGMIDAIIAATTQSDDGTTMPRWGARLPGVGPLEEYCGLYTYMHHNLNLLDGGVVQEFTAYSQIAEYWYGRCRAMFTALYERIAILNELQLLYYREMLRYINASVSGTIVIGRDFDEPTRVAILTKNAFVKFDAAKLFNPRYVANPDLRRTVYATADTPPAKIPAKVCYKYIDDIREGNKSMRGIAEIEAEIAKLETAIERHASRTPTSMWLEELAKIMPIVEEGRRTNWTYKTREDSYE